ncbi:MAG: hypothetical protein PHQ58_05110 [Rhodoferax sp.]|uniref:hypothetical protein n=1 Tax=Rhodoferax sp. TaxID=50421 RepID=UPI0026069E52|nr:hypothetical protein [Rhodoferax sp.]MDD2879794.1 hypothetical protein [Rhodoferax sp.]
MTTHSDLKLQQQLINKRESVLQRIAVIEDIIIKTMRPTAPAVAPCTPRSADIAYRHSYSCYEVDAIDAILAGETPLKPSIFVLHLKTLHLAAKVDKEYSSQYQYRSLPVNIVDPENLWYVGGCDGASSSGVLEWCAGETDAVHRLFIMSAYPQFTKLNASKYHQPKGIQTVVSLVWEPSEVCRVIEDSQSQGGKFVCLSLGKPGPSGKQPYRVVCKMPIPLK